MSTKRVKASAYDQYKAAMDKAGATYQELDGGTALAVVLSDGVQVVIPKGHTELTSVFVQCNPYTATGVDVKTLVPPTGGVKVAPDA